MLRYPRPYPRPFRKGLDTLPRLGRVFRKGTELQPRQVIDLRGKPNAMAYRNKWGGVIIRQPGSIKPTPGQAPRPVTWPFRVTLWTRGR